MAHSASLNLPYSPNEPHWLCVMLPDTPEAFHLGATLQSAGMKTLESQRLYVIQQSSHWERFWEQVAPLIHTSQLLDTTAAVIPGTQPPSQNDVLLVSQSPDSISDVARSLWLVEALQLNPITCHYQSIHDSKGKCVGYEALARIRDTKKDMASGKMIIEASQALNIQHIIDRHLQHEAVRSYAENQLDGMLFINLISGFIRKPASYLEEMGRAVEQYSVNPESLVLEVVHSSSHANMTHLKGIIEYCHEQGHRISLDDVIDLEEGKVLISRLRPDFIKLDIELLNSLLKSGQSESITEFCAFAHRQNCRVLAKRLEDKDTLKTLTECGINFYQGYLFSHPEAAENISAS